MYCPYPDDLNGAHWTLEAETTEVDSHVVYDDENRTRMVCDHTGKWITVLNEISNNITATNRSMDDQQHSAMTFVHQNYWIVVLPFVVLCIVASLCVTYQEK